MIKMLEKEADRRSTDTVARLLEVLNPRRQSEGGATEGGEDIKPIRKDDVEEDNMGELVDGELEKEDMSDYDAGQTGGARMIRCDGIPEGEKERDSEGAAGAVLTPEPCGRRCQVICENWPCRNRCDLRKNNHGRCVCDDHLPPPVDGRNNNHTFLNAMAAATRGVEGG